MEASTLPNAANTTRRASLSTLSHIVTTFADLCGDRSMYLQTVVVFMIIAEHPGILQCDLERRTTMASSSVSRNVAALGRNNRHGKPGLGLVRKRLSVRNPRSHELYLTAEGKALIERLTAPEEQQEAPVPGVALATPEAVSVAMWRV